MKKHIYVGFSQPKSWFQPFSWLIRKFQGTKYSHVMTLFPAEFLEGFSENDLICEAAKGSVRTVADRFFFPKIKMHLLFIVDLDDATFRKSFGVAASYMGADYSVVENIGIAVARFFRLKQNPFGGGPLKHKCSETTFYILSALDFNLSNRELDPDLLDVKDIEKIMIELSFTHPGVRLVNLPDADDLDLLN